jgi:hypothetical protein
MTATWHYFFYVNDITLTLNIINDITTADFSTESNPLFALNVSCALLFKCMISVSKNEIIKTANQLIDLFYQAVSMKANQSGWFIDYGAVHNKALVAMQMRECIEKNNSMDFKLIEKAANTCFRVTEKDYIKNALATIRCLYD